MIVARKDWREFVRDRRLLVMAVLALFISLAAIATSYARISAHETDRLAATARDRATWEGQGERNPHGVAHFGGWAMRPLTPLAVLDPGVTPYAGSVVWMEAHNWNPARNRPVEDQASAFDLGTFSLAWVLQYLVPLLIFILAAGLVARERERGTLRLLLVGGLGAKGLVARKAGSLAMIALALVLPMLLVGLAAAAAAGQTEPARLAVWLATYLVYFIIIAAIALAVTALARDTARALVFLIGLWLVAALLVPRAGASLAESVVPVPSADAFSAAIAETRETLPNVFDSEAAGFREFRTHVMRRYNVSRAEDLPVSLAGLQLDEDERIGNIAFDRHYSRLEQSYDDQRNLLRWFSLLSPLPALQNISMSLAGTSMSDQVAFQRQAELHRRALMSRLNQNMAARGRGQDFDYLAGPELWRQTPDFVFRPNGLPSSLRSAASDLAILSLWLVAALALLVIAARRLSREAL